MWVPIALCPVIWLDCSNASLPPPHPPSPPPKQTTQVPVREKAHHKECLIDLISSFKSPQRSSPPLNVVPQLQCTLEHTTSLLSVSSSSTTADADTDSSTSAIHRSAITNAQSSLPTAFKLSLACGTSTSAPSNALHHRLVVAVVTLPCSTIFDIGE